MSRLLIVAIGLWILGASSPSVAEEPAPRERAADAITNLGCTLYRQLAKDAKASESFLVSPTSAGTILAIASLGTDPAATDEIRNLLGVDRLDEAFHTALATSLAEYERAGLDAPAYSRTGVWLDTRVNLPDPVNEQLRKIYRPFVGRADFRKPAMLQRILNSWVSEQTRGQITDLASRGPGAPSDNMAAVNALLIDAKWRSPFPKEETKSEDFFLTADRSTKVPMMHVQTRFRYASTETEELVELPYRDAAFAFVLVVPRARDGLGDLEKRLTGELVRTWEKELARIPNPDHPIAPVDPKNVGQGFFDVPAVRPPEVDLSLPRFGFYRRIDLRKVLEDAGATRLFDPAQRVGNELILRSCDQAIRIDLDEEGTRVVVASKWKGAGGMGGIPDRVKVRADHPFLFYLRDYRSGLMLAVGRLTDPAQTRKAR